MSKVLINSIIKTIQGVIGRGTKELHDPLFVGNEMKYLSQTIKSSFVSNKGQHTNLFERKIEKYTKAKFAISLVNATQAIYIALKACGVQKNHEVLVPALTFIGTVNAISYLSAEPHFVDSHIRDFGIDCHKLQKYLKKIVIIKKKKSINRYSGRIISAIVPVHVFGHACDIDKIKNIAKKYNLIVIEDAAEALGSFYKNKHLGTFGDAGCISFNGNKIITTGGGGIILTNKKKIAKKILHLVMTSKIHHRWEYIHDEIGYNFRMPSLNAALGLAQLEKIDLFIKAKRDLFLRYTNKFSKIKEVSIYKELKKSKSNYWLQTLILSEKNSFLKNKILKKLHSKSIKARPAWKLISSLKPYKKKFKMNLSGAENIYKRIINLPSSQNLMLKKIYKSKFF
jgi:aminotransferase in exopolysaccharide biosynthesis